MKLWKLCVCICMSNMYCTIWQKGLNAFGETGLYYHLFATIFFMDIYGIWIYLIPLLPPLPLAFSHFLPVCLFVQFSMTKHCWKAGHICTAKLYPHNFTDSPVRACKKMTIPEFECWEWLYWPRQSGQAHLERYLTARISSRCLVSFHLS